MILRYEQVKDYSKIAQLNYLAFSNWHPQKISVHESEMVALARQSSMFDPELSIVAEKDGGIIGHVLLVPSHFVVLGQRVKGVLLGPIAVLPRYQKSGMGKKLIEKGHAIAKEKGYEFSLLAGHPSYYPKFGYLQNVFSIGGTKIEIKNPCMTNNTLSERPLRLDDIPVIHKWQANIRQKDSLAIFYDENLMEYHANALYMKSMVIVKNDTAVGFAKYSINTPSHIQTLFFHEDYLDSILCYLLNKSQKSTITIQQPCEIFDRLLSNETFIVSDVRKAKDPFMICPFSQDSLIHTYCNKAIKKEIPLGVISYPPYCDVDV